ncbi:Uncharacterized protein FWK35_00005586 [Aphis craccivora]|uniref:Uncharacterized protein n=1 Tax=Aphis craccivora TaxID=307492 RepID=A0A6G0YTP7_APHCR|nr:Uncharacterized protein FWK35_00005586 [Aphis craccivora]
MPSIQQADDENERKRSESRTTKNHQTKRGKTIAKERICRTELLGYVIVYGIIVVGGPRMYSGNTSVFRVSLCPLPSADNVFALRGTHVFHNQL